MQPWLCATAAHEISGFDWKLLFHVHGIICSALLVCYHGIKTT
jgi:hypothetical protein